MSKQALIEFIREEVWRAVSRSAGLVGGMNIGKYSGEMVSPPFDLGSIEDDDNNKESEQTEEDAVKQGQKRRQRR